VAHIKALLFTILLYQQRVEQSDPWVKFAVQDDPLFDEFVEDMAAIGVN